MAPKDIMNPTEAWRVVRRARHSGRVIRILQIGDERTCAAYLAALIAIKPDASLHFLTQRLYTQDTARALNDQQEWRNEAASREPLALRLWRVEASVPAIQHVEARTREEAITLACENRDGWDVDLDAEINADHIADCEAEE